MKHLALSSLVALAALGSAQVMAQAGSAAINDLGGGLTDAVCGFINSNIVAALAAIALLVLFFLWFLDEARGFMGSLLKIAIGVALILNINTVLRLLQLPSIC